MDLDRYSDYHIEYIEADPISEVCNGCNDDCGSCENAGLRWYLSKKDELIISRKGKAQAVKRLLREIARIDAEIEVIEDGGS